MNVSLLKRISSLLFVLGLVAITSVQSAAAASHRLTKIEIGINGYTANPNSPFEGYVGMYQVTPATRYTYAGKLISVKKVSQGKGVTFNIKPNQLVNFVAFSDRTTAQRAKSWTFTTPPYKNFPEYNPNQTLCQTNYLDTQSPLMRMSNGSQYSVCVYKFLPVTVSDSMIVFEDNTRQLSSSQLAVVEASPMTSNAPESTVKNATVRLYDQYDRQVAQASSGERGIASFILRRGKQYYFSAQKDAQNFGGRMKVYYPNQTALFYVSSDGKKLFDSYEGSSTYTLTQNLYLRSGTTVTTPAPVQTPAPTPTYPQTAPVGTSLATPVLNYPSDNFAVVSNSATVFIGWGSVLYGYYYDVNIEQKCANCASWSDFQRTSVYGTSMTSAPLNQNRQYRVRVQAHSNNNVTSQWSTYRYFSYGNYTQYATGLPVAPTIVTPVENYTVPVGQSINNTMQLVQWTPVSGVNTYTMSVESLCAACSNWSEVRQLTVTGRTDFYTDALIPGSSYRVRVRAENNETLVSEWSAYRYFSYPQVPSLVAPTVTSPMSNSYVMNRMVNLAWTSVASATSYEFQVTCTTCENGISSGIQKSIAAEIRFTLPYDPNKPIPDYATYRVRVRAIREEATGPWSAYSYFNYDAFGVE